MTRSKVKNYTVERLINGVWEFWFNGRGKSAADLKRRICWTNKKATRDNVRVFDKVEN